MEIKQRYSSRKFWTATGWTIIWSIMYGTTDMADATYFNLCLVGIGGYLVSNVAHAWLTKQ